MGNIANERILKSIIKGQYGIAVQYLSNLADGQRFLSDGGQKLIDKWTSNPNAQDAIAVVRGEKEGEDAAVSVLERHKEILHWYAQSLLEVHNMNIDLEENK